MKNKIKSALISVWDKEGLDVVVRQLDALGVDIISTGGTYDYILELGIPVRSVEEITGHEEILDGRVKTLHPSIFGGILFRRSSKEDIKQVKSKGIPTIDLVIVDLYPFEETIANFENGGLTDDDAIEKIDIGGVSLIRAAAKNHKDVLVIGHRGQYDLLMQVLNAGGSTTFEERRDFAIDAFNITSNYDAEIFKYLLGPDPDDLDVLDLMHQKPVGGLSFNIETDDYSLNDFLICWDKFGTRPNRLLMQGMYSTRLFEDAISDLVTEKNVFSEAFPDSNGDLQNDRVFVKIDEGCYMSYLVVDRESEDSFIDSIQVLYSDGYSVDVIRELLSQCQLQEDEESSVLNAISISQGGLELEPISMSGLDSENVQYYYSRKTFSSIGKMVKKMRKTEGGMIVIHGERGTGKTSIVKHLADKLGRMVVFVPNNMIDHTINNPEFRKFLRRLDRPVLILDDCEQSLGEVFNRPSQTTTNLIQLVDGMFSESTGVSVVCIFNVEDEDEIDFSILDSNNLIDVLEFDRLSSEEAKELSTHLGKSKKYNNGARMIDVVRKRDVREKSEIGF